MAKTQCWEFTKCNSEKNASCPTVVQKAGRSCWLVAGSFCGGPIQCKVAHKFSNCKECDFHKKVRNREL